MLAVDGYAPHYNPSGAGDGTCEVTRNFGQSGQKKIAFSPPPRETLGCSAPWKQRRDNA